jgi:hypothetical protein
MTVGTAYREDGSEHNKFYFDISNTFFSSLFHSETNVFLTTVDTATPPGGKMGESSPFTNK